MILWCVLIFIYNLKVFLELYCIVNLNEKNKKGWCLSVWEYQRKYPSLYNSTINRIGSPSNVTMFCIYFLWCSKYNIINAPLEHHITTKNIRTLDKHTSQSSNIYKGKGNKFYLIYCWSRVVQLINPLTLYLVQVHDMFTYSAQILQNSRFQNNNESH